MSKHTRLKLVKACNKLLEDKHQLEREKAWLIKQVRGFTYHGLPMSPPGYPFCEWDEAATIATLPEDKRKNFKIKLQKELEKKFNGK